MAAQQDKPALPVETEPEVPAPAGPRTVKVRLSHRPDETAEVPEDELPQLRNHGLLLEGKPATKATSGATGRQ